MNSMQKEKIEERRKEKPIIVQLDQIPARKDGKDGTVAQNGKK